MTLTTLAARIVALNPRWTLRAVGDELELSGNGPVAAWRTLASCVAWIAYQERTRR